MDLDGLLVPFQPAILGNPGPTRDGSVNEVFVPDFVERCSQRGAPVIHQALVGGVVLGEVVEVITERIGFAKQHSIHCEAAVDGLSIHQDQLGARHRAMDGAQVQIVHRQLLDDGAGQRIATGQQLIASRNGGGIGSCRAGEYIASISRCSGEQRLTEILGFAVRTNAGQAQQHVLEQRGTGTRQADDEDVSVVGIAPSGANGLDVSAAIAAGTGRVTSLGNTASIRSSLRRSNLTS